MAAALACRKMGMECTVIVPGSTPQSAADNIKEHGAKVEYFGKVWDDADEEARRRLSDDSVLYINPFDHPKIWTGHSTVIDEIKEDLAGRIPSLVVCSVGGGGLLLGVLEGLERNDWSTVPVLAMETFGAESLNSAMEKRQLVRLDDIRSIAKSLGSKQVASAALKKSMEHPGKVYSKVCHDTQCIKGYYYFYYYNYFYNNNCRLYDGRHKPPII